LPIICKNHGIFYQNSETHILNKGGCILCAGVKLKTTDEFISDARKIHGNKYDYSLVVYKNMNTLVSIVCALHGQFIQKPKDHIHSKTGCPKCGINISNPEIEWLNHMGVPDTVTTRQVKLSINGKNMLVDAYNLATNTVYEFWGDYWHGNPLIFASDKINKSNKKTFGELYNGTQLRRQLILNAGYNLIDIWESDWKILKRQNKS
jgi:hypothetical protein